MLTKDQEKILRWLLSLKTDIKNTITISNSMTKYPNGYTDKQIIKNWVNLRTSDLSQSNGIAKIMTISIMPLM